MAPFCVLAPEIPSPRTPRERVDSTVDFGLDEALLPEVGVAGDCVPVLDFRAAERGVILPLNAGVNCPSLASWGLAVATDVCRPRRGGDVGDKVWQPASLGVNGLFVCLKAELRFGVRGLAWMPFNCLSRGMLEVGDCCVCTERAT